MNLENCMTHARAVLRAGLVAVIMLSFTVPAVAQNKRRSWEVFIYFGSFFANDVPGAKQFGDIRTLRAEPNFAVDPNDPSQVVTPNLGKIGGEQPPDPNYPFDTAPGNQFGMAPCNGDNGPLASSDPNIDPRAPFFDECDNDQEGRYIYNASGITTNGEIQTDDSEFMLGVRGGYSFTRHLQIEVDLGFGKQRLDLTRNLDPLLTASVNSIADPRAAALAKFYQFTWANVDYQSIVNVSGSGEHPEVIASRVGRNSSHNIPIYFPTRFDDANYILPAGETFEDVTGFINRVFQDPTAFRNRGNQINIDNFNLSVAGNWNFNTKPDSRIIPYVTAGFGRLFRNFDSPWDGEDSDFLTYGGGIRFFVNEIFAFRADLRAVNYSDDSFEITAKMSGFDLPDRVFSGFGGCVRDQRAVQPPCAAASVPAAYAFPLNGGGSANVRVDAELDDFFEIRIGFDVVLGGR